MPRSYQRTYQQDRSLSRHQRRRFRVLLADAEAALSTGKRKLLLDALANIQRAGRELPRGHRAADGLPSWRTRFAAMSRALADKMAAQR
jgi:hypothetical protein